MGSNSSRKSGSSGRSKARKRVVIGAEETVRVRYKQNSPHVESERRNSRQKRTSDGGARQKSGAGRQLANAKRSERERRQQVIRFRRSAVAMAGVVAVVFTAWAFVALYNAPIFTVTSIEVTGNRHLSDATVLRKAAIERDATLIKVPRRAIERRLSADPWVASADVERDFPHALRIRLVERKPVAVVDQGGANLWIVSSDGYWLGKRSAEETGLVQITDVGRVAVRPGARVANPEVRNAIKVVEALREPLRKSVVSVTAPSVDKTALRTRDDVEIFVGEATEMGKKDRIAREILRQHPKAVYINVRVPDDPTWRGLQVEPE